MTTPLALDAGAAANCPRRLTAPEAAELIRAHYAPGACGEGAGGCMHVQLDDGNLDPCHFGEECEAWVKDCGCKTGYVVFSALRVMRTTARRRAYYLAFRRGDR